MTSTESTDLPMATSFAALLVAGMEAIMEQLLTPFSRELEASITLAIKPFQVLRRLEKEDLALLRIHHLHRKFSSCLSKELKSILQVIQLQEARS